MSKNVVSALIVAAVLLLWLGSGLFFGEPGSREHATIAARSQSDGASDSTERKRVRVEVIKSELRHRFLVLRGRTQSKRTVEVKSEINGKLIARPVERGAHVEKGDVLCELAVDDREVAVTEAQAALADASMEHEGSLKLKEQGLMSQIAIASTYARQEASRAQLHRQVLNLERTRITAPFKGVVEELHMNVGDFAVPGAPCVTLIDLDPMLISAHVTESEVENLAVGDLVSAVNGPGLADSGLARQGREFQGKVTFVAMQSDEVTRTYPVEITVDNRDYSIRSGLTVNVRIDLGQVPAHRISPALFALGDDGEIGVRTLDESNRVTFQRVRIIEDGPEGVWITGLPDSTDLITVGQEFVAAGEIVEPVYPAQTSDQS